MKVGDKVRVVDEEGVFIIKEIDKTQTILLDKYGFESIYPLTKLTPNNLFKDIEFNTKEVIKEKRIVQDKKKGTIIRSKEGKVREIDLHIGQLVESFKNLQAHQMLQKQINIARIEIDKAKKDKIEKLILIHGKGKGVLKNELYELLKTIDRIEYFEADIIKYRFGAVEIRFK